MLANRPVLRVFLLFAGLIIAGSAIVCVFVGVARGAQEQESATQAVTAPPPRYNSFAEALAAVRNTPLAIGDIVLDVAIAPAAPRHPADASGDRIVWEQIEQARSADYTDAQILALDNERGDAARLLGYQIGAASGATQGPYGLKDQLEVELVHRGHWVVEPYGARKNKPAVLLDGKVALLEAATSGSGFDVGPLASAVFLGVILIDRGGYATWGAYTALYAAAGTHTLREEVDYYVVLNLQIRSLTGRNIYEQDFTAGIRAVDSRSRNIFGKFSYGQRQLALAGITRLLVPKAFGPEAEAGG